MSSSRVQVLLSIGAIVLLAFIMNIVYINGLLKVDEHYSGVIEEGVHLKRRVQVNQEKALRLLQRKFASYRSIQKLQRSKFDCS